MNLMVTLSANSTLAKSSDTAIVLVDHADVPNVVFVRNLAPEPAVNVPGTAPYPFEAKPPGQHQTKPANNDQP